MTFRNLQFHRSAAPMLLALLLLGAAPTARAAPDMPAGADAPTVQPAGVANPPDRPVLAWHRVGSPAPGREPAIG